MFCRKCGNQMPDDSVFCGKCGFNQKEQISSSPHPSHPIQPSQFPQTSQYSQLYQPVTPNVQPNTQPDAYKNVRSNVQPFSSFTNGNNGNETIYFDHSTKAVTKFIVLAIIFVIGLLISVAGINSDIESLREHYWLHEAEISLLKSMRGFGIVIGVILIGATLWNCYITSKNHLHISEGILNGVSCSYLGSTDLMGFITMNLRDLKVTDITKVIVKNNYTLVIMTNKKYVFLIEDAQKAREIICRYTQ